MRLITFHSTSELRGATERWDELWAVAEPTPPTARAELVAQWVEQFAARARLIVLAVEQDRQLVAALPLVVARVGGLPIAQLAANCWSPAGDLLVTRSSTELRAIIDTLADGLKRLPASLVCFDKIPSLAPRWQALLHGVADHLAPPVRRFGYDAGLIHLGPDWQLYESCLSSNHRRAIRKTLKRLEAEAPVTLHRYDSATPEQASELLDEVCRVEDLGWKGEAGTSINRTAGMRDFFQRQARQLAEWGRLEIFLLRQAERTMAVEYGFGNRTTYFAHKIAYDPAFRQHGPGRLLRYLQLRQFTETRAYQQVDTLGVMTEANARWATSSYPVERVVFSTGQLTGDLAMAAYQHVWPHLRRWVRPAPEPASHELPHVSAFLQRLEEPVERPLGALPTPLVFPSSDLGAADLSAAGPGASDLSARDLSATDQGKTDVATPIGGGALLS